ncbi:MAG: hypothetical protein JSS70_15590 [Bacteroidetes bacterium]|nr:hypothetical protein [Bacteroidota bacterium]
MKLILAILLSFLLLNACSPGKKIQVWKNKALAMPPIRKVMVVGMMRNAKDTIRQKTEDIVCEELKKAGIEAVSSLKILGANTFEKMDEDDALYQLNNYCVDAVLTVTVLNRTKESRYTAGSILYTPFGYYYDRFWRYRTTLQHRLAEDTYYTNEEHLFFECNIYTMVTQKLVYSFHSGNFRYLSYPEALVHFAVKISKNLTR